MEYKLSDLGTFINGANFPKGSYGKGIKIINVKDLFPSHFVSFSGLTELKRNVLKSPDKYLVKHGDILFTRSSLVQDGTGMCAMIEHPKEDVIFCGFIIRFRPSLELVNPYYLVYLLRSSKYRQMFIKLAAQTTITNINQATLGNIIIQLPSKDTQDKIATVLRKFDNKIELNNRINENLEQQAQALYRRLFVDTPEAIAQTCRADEFFDISIGKTPPRKEPQWFTHDPNEVTWVSIADMGSCGVFISESSEQLTKEAVTKHNVKVVPDNTVLLSFKLTVGRIAITDGEMTTNEAIAHFKTNRPEINEYLFCYLRDYNYQTMGSTSSIATAVNSKIIKAMSFPVPEDKTLAQFHMIAGPMFAQIKANQRECKRLSEMRDTLLPKLMSGELDVSEIIV